MELHENIGEIIDTLAQEPVFSIKEAALRGVFYPLGLPVEIVTNSLTVLDAAHESWGHLRPRHFVPMVQIRICVLEADGDSSATCPPIPAWHMQGHLLSLHADDDNTASADLKKGFGVIRLSHVAANDHAYIRYHFIESVTYILLSSLYAMPMHAACISRRGRGVLLWGTPGAGKTTLAYACARAGWTFTSDDGSYALHSSISPTARVVGNCFKVRFRPAAKNLFPELQSYDLTPRAIGKPSIEIPTAELPGLITAQETNVHYIVFLDREPSERAELKPIPIETALQRFHSELYPKGDIRKRQLEILNGLSNLEAFELRYETLAQAIEQLEWLTGQASAIVST